MQITLTQGLGSVTGAVLSLASAGEVQTVLNALKAAAATDPVAQTLHSGLANAVTDVQKTVTLSGPLTI